MEVDLVEFARMRSTMLRDLRLHVDVRGGAPSECAHELRHAAVAAHGTESATGFVQRGADPAQHHRAVTPAFDVARVMRDEPVQVLDRIGRAERPIESAVHARAPG